MSYVKPYENEPQQRFFVIISDIYYTALKAVTNIISHTDMPPW